MPAASPSTLLLGFWSDTDAGADWGQASRQASADSRGAVVGFEVVETLLASAASFDPLAAGPLLLPLEPGLLSAPVKMKRLFECIRASRQSHSCLNGIRSVLHTKWSYMGT